MHSQDTNSVDELIMLCGTVVWIYAMVRLSWPHLHHHSPPCSCSKCPVTTGLYCCHDLLGDMQAGSSQQGCTQVQQNLLLLETR